MLCIFILMVLNLRTPEGEIAKPVNEMNFIV